MNSLEINLIQVLADDKQSSFAWNCTSDKVEIIKYISPFSHSIASITSWSFTGFVYDSTRVSLCTILKNDCFRHLPIIRGLLQWEIAMVEWWENTSSVNVQAQVMTQSWTRFWWVCIFSPLLWKLPTPHPPTVLCFSTPTKNQNWFYLVWINLNCSRPS